MRGFRELKGRILHKCGKPGHAKAQDQTVGETSEAQSQPEDPFMQEDLWQCAFDQLDQKDQSILRSEHDPATNSDENRPQVIDEIEQVIEITKGNYEKYQERGGIKISRSTGEVVDLRKLAKKIIDAALDFQTVISKGVACDATGYAASAWAVVSLGLTVSNENGSRR